MSPIEEIIIEKQFSVFKLENNNVNQITFQKELGTDIIQFYFCLRGKGLFLYNQGAYTMPLQENQSLLLYNPQKQLPIHLNVAENSAIICLLIPIKKFHSLFSSEAEFIGFLTDENKEKKYYTEEKITPAIAIVLTQMLNASMHPSVKNLFYKGKTYELLSLVFNYNEEQNIDNCPFLSDEEDVLKIKQAKDIIIQQMTN